MRALRFLQRPFAAVWRRAKRPWKIAAGIVLLLLLLRLALALATPPLLRSVLSGMGLDVRWSQWHLALVEGEVLFRDLEVSAAETGERFVLARYARVRLSWLDLLRGDVVLQRVDLDRADLDVRRRADGRLALLAALPADEDPKPPESASHEGGPFELPIALRELRLQRTTVRWRDETHEPPVERDLRIDLRADDVATGGPRPARFELQMASSDGWFTCDLQALVHLERHAARLDVDLRRLGVRPRALEPWLAGSGIATEEGTLALRGAFEAFLVHDAERGTSGRALLRDVALEHAGRRSVALGRLEAELRRLDGATVELGRVSLEGLHAQVERARGERLAFAGLAFAGGASPTAADDAQAASPPATTAMAPALRVALEQVRFEDLSLRVVPREGADGRPVELRLDAFTTSAIAWQDGALAPLTYRLRLAVTDVIDRIDVEGALRHVPDASDGSLTIAMSGVDPTPFAAELRRHGVTARSAELGAALRLSFARAREEQGHERWDAALEGLEVRAGRTPLARVDRVELRGARLGALRREMERVTVRGVDLSVRRLRDGGWQALGFEIAAPDPAKDGTGATLPPGAPAEAQREAPLAATPEFLLGLLETEGVALTLVDESVQPHALLALRDLRVRVQDASTTPRPADAPTRFEAAWSVSDVVERARLAGRLTDEGPRRRLVVDLAGDGFRDAALHPYLRPFGLELERASTACELHAEVAFDRAAPLAGATDVFVTHARLGAPDDPDLDLRALRLAGVRSAWDAERGRTVHRVEELALERLFLRARAAADGSWRALGWRHVPPPSSPASAGSAAPAPAPASAGTDGGTPDLPILELPRITVGEVALDLGWRDANGRRLDQPLTFAFETRDLRFDPDAETAPATTPYALELRLPGTVTATRVEGRFGAAARAFSVDGALDVRGITLGRLQALLAEHGLAWVADEATLRSTFAVAAQRRPAGLALDARVDGLTFEDAHQRWLALQTLRVEQLALEAGRADLETFELGEPFLYARFEEGTTTALGLRMSPQPRAASPSVPTTPSNPPAPSAPTPEAGALDLHVARIAVRGARFEIDGPPGLDRERLVVTSQLDATDLTVGERGDAGQVDWKLALPELLDEVHVHGELAPHRREGRARLACDVRGIRPGLITSALPGQEVGLEDGSLSLALDARYGFDAGGGMRGRLELANAAFRDAGDEIALLAFERLVMAAETDGAGTAWRVREARCEGLETRAARRTDGSLEVCGLRFAPQTEAASPPAVAATAPGAATVLGPTLPPGFRPAPRRALPRLRFDELDLELRSFTWTDHGRPDAAPVVTRSRLRAPHAFELFGSGARDLVPDLVLEGALPPAITRYRFDVGGELLALDPHASLRWTLEGIDGDALLELVPALRTWIAASDLEDAVLEGEAALQLALDRRDPLEFDLARPFGLRMDVSRVALRDTHTGVRHFGVDGWSLEADPIDLGRREIVVTRAELYHPVLELKRHAGGLDVPGFTLRMADPAAPPPTAPAAPTRSTGDGEATRSAAEPGWRVRVEEFALHAGEFTYTDTTCKLTEICAAEGECSGQEVCRHVLRIPVNDLTFQATGLSSHPQEQAQPLTFEFGVSGRPVALRKRKSGVDLLNVGDTLSFFTNVVGNVTGLDTAKFEYESRPVFNSIRSKGTLDLRSGTVGELELHVDDFEMFALAGLAKQSGVDINDGVVRSDVALTFRRNGTIALDSLTVFSDLDLSEPAGGPIQQYLGLDTPVNQVIGLLRDDRGQHRIPVRDDNLTEMSQGKVIGLVAEVLVDLLARAALGSPSRVFNVVVDLTGSIARRIPLVNGVWDFVFGAPPTPEELAPIVFEFAPGDASIPRTAYDALRVLEARLATHERMYVVVRHRSGRDDLDRVAVMAKPSARDREDYLERLMLEKRRLVDRRVELLEQFEQAIRASRAEAVVEARNEVQEIDVRLGQIELTLDQLYRLRDLGPDLAQERKARDLAGQLASLRLERVREAIFDTLGSEFETLDQRVRISSPTLSNPLPCGGGYLIIEPRVVR